MLTLANNCDLQMIQNSKSKAAKIYMNDIITVGKELLHLPTNFFSELGLFN